MRRRSESGKQDPMAGRATDPPAAHVHRQKRSKAGRDTKAPPCMRFVPLNQGTRDEQRQARLGLALGGASSLEEQVDRIRAARTTVDLQLCSVAVSESYGFSLFGGGLARAESDGVALRFLCDGDPGWIAHYRSALMASDPLVARCRTASAPWHWTAKRDLASLANTSSALAEAISSWSIAGFVTVPVHGPASILSGFRFGYSHADGLSDADVTHALPMLTFFSMHLYEALRRVVGPATAQRPQLSPRQLDVLSWIAHGKTSWEISRVLGVSENTVLAHIREIYRKLGVHNRNHAVATAVSCGLIDYPILFST